MTNALRQPGGHSCHRKALSARAGSQRPVAAEASLRAGNLIISAGGAGAPGSTAALSGALEALPAWEAVQRAASPHRAAGLETSLFILSWKPSWFQNRAWALPGSTGTDGAFILAVLSFNLGPKAGLGANNGKIKRKKKKNHRLPSARPRLSQGGLRVGPFSTHISIIRHLGNDLVPSPVKTRPLSPGEVWAGEARDLAVCRLRCRPA